MLIKTEGPELVRIGVLDCQVCVPVNYTDDQVKKFAEQANPCGTEKGWSIRRAGDKALLGFPERNPCAKRKGFVHIVLDC